jgi:predicted RNase H-like nuclease (RuvC/YqgF family)
MFEKEAEEYVKQNYCEMCVMADDCKCGCIDCFTVQAYLAGAEPREKRIAELEMTVGTLRTFSNEQATNIENLQKENAELKKTVEHYRKEREFFISEVEK